VALQGIEMPCCKLRNPLKRVEKQLFIAVLVRVNALLVVANDFNRWQ
jgi:hypothetical protein